MPHFAKQKALADPTGFALAEADRLLNWSDVDSALNRCASRLLEADLGPHRRVAVFAENAPETALAHLGALIAGASSVPMNFHLTAAEAAYMLEDSGARVLFVGPETVERGSDAARDTDIDTIVGWGCDGVEGVTDWQAWLADGTDVDPADDIEPRPNLLYTSGTTGRPKATELPPTMFAGGATMGEHLHELGKNPLAHFGAHLVVGPMYHTGPLSGMRLLAAGTPSVVLGRFDAEATLAAIAHHRVGSTVMVPTHFVRLLALPEEVRESYDVSSLRWVTHTGAKCPIEVKEAMIRWWGPIFIEAYGATEVGTVCRITSEEWLEHKGSVGRAIAPFSAHILDSGFDELPAGTEGKLFFRDETGRGIIYANDAGQTKDSNPQPGLFTLGEIGYMDEDGYVFITDRFSDMVVSGGVNIYPAEAELQLIDHPQIADVACIGIPSTEMGEEMKALIIAKAPGDPPDLDDMATWLRDRLTHYKCPRSYELVDSLLRNTMGKINKRALRDAYLAGSLPQQEMTWR